MSEKYNGWSNYATWRVKLECINDDYYTEQGIIYDTVLELAEQIQSDVEEYLQNEDSGNIAGAGICYHYALAFLSDVNWYEIAESIVSDYPELIKKD